MNKHDFCVQLDSILQMTSEYGGSNVDKICIKYFLDASFLFIPPGSRPLAAVARSGRVMSHEAGQPRRL